MRIGVTGSRYKRTLRQGNRLHCMLRDGLGEYLIDDDEITELHHGACQGADALAHEIALALQLWIVVHPPINDTWVAPECLEPAPRVRILKPKGYLSRDDDIVRATGGLIALPNSYEPQPHSGTWYTIGRAKDEHKPTWIIFPNGITKYEANDAA